MSHDFSNKAFFEKTLYLTNFYISDIKSYLHYFSFTAQRYTFVAVKMSLAQMVPFLKSEFICF